MSKSNKLTNDIIDHLYSVGAFGWRASSIGVFDQKQQAYRTAPKKGVSDVLAVIPPNGQLIAIEVKIGKDRLSDEQIGFMKNIEHMGGLTFVAKDIESFKEWYKKLSTG